MRLHGVSVALMQGLGARVKRGQGTRTSHERTGGEPGVVALPETAGRRNGPARTLRGNVAP